MIRFLIDVFIPLCLTVGAAIALVVMIDCEIEIREWIESNKDGEE